MSVTIKDTDRGATALLTRLLGEGALYVGIHGDAGQHDGSDLSVAEIGEIHEFGLGSAPRRSFLADWFDGKRDEWETVIVKGGRALARGKVPNVRALLEQVGVWAVGSIQDRMANNIPPPLAPATIKRKGSSIALIDTGQLRSSITYKVELDKLPAGGA
jgi:hypothetical protein